MRIAVLSDDLIQFGGQEKLVLVVLEMFKESEFFAPVISKKWKKILDEKKIKYTTSFMQKLPFVERFYRFYSLFLIHIFAIETFNFDKYDVLFSISSRYSHFAITKPSTKHICYMNSPGRMFWEIDDYFEKEYLSGIKVLNTLLVNMVRPFLFLIRLLNYGAIHRVDYIISNSINIKKKISRFYGRDSVVIYPFFDLDTQGITFESENYYLIISRLLSWKKIDIAIQACTNLNLNLKIIGEGPDAKRLSKLANKNIEFLGYVSEVEKTKYLLSCKALINTQKEDFGIVPLEAMYCGRPVIGFSQGGIRETVIPSVTGELFDEQTAESLTAVLKNFDANLYNRDNCIKQAEKFKKEVFSQKIKEFVFLS